MRTRASGMLVMVAMCGRASADTDLSFYGDVEAMAKSDGTRAGTQDGFSAAKLDLFTTTTIKRWSFLVETMFEAGEDNTFVLDVERVGVGYLHSEWLRLFVGRFHTAIGYYNDAFHHGAYFMVPVGRPTMVEFEDGGGLIAAHNIGIHADGRFELGDDHLRYDLEIANGRGASPLDIQNDHDTNRPKAINVRLRYEPSGALDGLIMGGNLYFDSIPGTEPVAAAGTAIAGHGAMHEWLVGAHAAYFENGMHAIAEAIAVQHTDLATGSTHRTYAAFAELGHVFDALTPYVRYEWTRFPREGDPYYAKTRDDSYQAASLGVKHATTENIALKAQASVAVPLHAGADPVLTVTGQVAFAF